MMEYKFQPSQIGPNDTLYQPVQPLHDSVIAEQSPGDQSVPVTDLTSLQISSHSQEAPEIQQTDDHVIGFTF